MIEKRRNKRWNILKDARFRREGEAKYLNCTVDDISYWGMKISCLENLKSSTIVEMHVDIPDVLNPIIVKAKVIWVKSTIRMYRSYGLDYIDITERDKEKIYHHIFKSYPSEFKKSNLQEDALKIKGGEGKMEDRRVFARISTNFPVRFLDAHRNKEGLAVARDISANGVGIVSDKRLKPHAPVELWLKIPDQGSPLYTRGEVVWVKTVKPKEYYWGVALEKADLMGFSRLLR